MRRLVLPLAVGDEVARRVIRLPEAEEVADPLAPWADAAATASGPCLVADADGVIVAMSPSAAALLSTTPEQATGRGLLDVIRIIDFHTGAPTTEYAARVPPLAAVTGSAHSRALIRVAGPDAHLSIDAVAAPIYAADGRVVGAVSFLAAVGSQPGP